MSEASPCPLLSAGEDRAVKVLSVRGVKLRQGGRGSTHTNAAMHGEGDIFSHAKRGGVNECRLFRNFIVPVENFDIVTFLSQFTDESHIFDLLWD